MHPEWADRRLNRQFEEYIHKVIISNRQTIKFILEVWSRPLYGFEIKSRLVSDLNRQQDHLRQLLIDKSSIWPSNWGAKWRERQAKLALRMYYFFGLSLYSSSAVATMIADEMNYELLRSTNQLPLNRLERLSQAEVLIGVLVVGSPFISAIVVLMTNFHDRALQLSCISGRLKALNRSLFELKSIRQHEAAINTDERNLEREALEVYLSLRVWLTELRPTIELANMIMNQCLIFVILLLMSTLYFYWNVDPSHMNIMAIIFLTFVAAINFSLMIGAAFEASCKKTIQLIWSLLANLSSAPRPDRQSESLFQREKSQTRWSGRWSRGMAMTFVEDSVINPHTIFLWRQLLDDQQCLNSRFNCTIMNMVRLNYESLLRINFWFISVVLIYLTERR